MSQKLISNFNGEVPSKMEELITLDGVGRKTTNVVLANLYNEPCIAVDTHVERVSKRLRLAYAKDNVLTIEKKLMKKFPKNEWGRRHVQLVLFGRYYCKAVKPLCEDRKLKDICRKKY